MLAEAKKAMGTKLDFIAQRAAREPKERFNNLMHHINKSSLEANFYKLGRNRAVGVDSISWQEYNKKPQCQSQRPIGAGQKDGL